MICSIEWMNEGLTAKLVYEGGVNGVTKATSRGWRESMRYSEKLIEKFKEQNAMCEVMYGYVWKNNDL